ncbi:MAG: hypothetical protein QOJ70_167 [Acidobacteriota bacterium]|jgi:hypothetical protein|nr:hypothetical protein [Acidobacteriota bacterium]
MKRVLFSVLFILLSAAPVARAQTPAAAGGEIVDRMVAVINGSELITYSDLLWQLALQPGMPLDSPRREDLRRTLDLLIDQRLVLQEAEKLPHVHATEKEIDDGMAELIRRFPSLEEFHLRLDRTGLTAAQLREIIHDRLDMEKYLDFRFRSFTVVTPQEVESYYRDVYVARRRRQAPGQIVPELKTVYNNIQTELIESKIESDTDDFLEEARTAAQITILDDSLGDGGTKPAGGSGGPGAGRTRPSKTTKAMPSPSPNP